MFHQFRLILEQGRRDRSFRSVDPLTTHMMIAGLVMLLVAGTPLRLRLRELEGVPVTLPLERVPQDLANSVSDLVIHGLRACNVTPERHPASIAGGSSK